MNVILIGSGNVASHLGKALQAAGICILQVWSRDAIHAESLASALDATAISNINQVRRDADIYILSVKDDALSDMSEALMRALLAPKSSDTPFKGLVVHTSGAVGMGLFAGKFEHYGVFYPLQTFSKSKVVDFGHIPLCLEAADTKSFAQLDGLAHRLSTRVVAVNSDQRQILHLAAVFACNFPNYLYGLAADLLEKNGLSFDMLRPLILETAMKVQDADPQEVQTGPAIRHDEQTLLKHQTLLKNMPEWALLYQLLSDSIKKSKK